MSADDTARTDGPTVGWVMRTSDADLMLHAQVVWQQLNKRGLTEPRTAEAQEWVDTHLKVVEALETAQAELVETRDRRDYLRGQLDIIYDAEYSRNDTLKRRIAVLEGAGNTLADRLERVALFGPAPPEVDAWRSAAGGETRG